MAHIETAKHYNADPENISRLAIAPSGGMRQTGYVLISDNGERRWFSNTGQAKQWMKEPGKYGERGKVLFTPESLTDKK
jgi:hypothetical protein